jgi:predicted Rossmann-fold nucleotide-binding protein
LHSGSYQRQLPLVRRSLGPHLNAQTSSRSRMQMWFRISKRPVVQKGTLDELFEALTLIQTAKIRNFPIVIMGTSYWKELIEFTNKMAETGMIKQADVNFIYTTDSVEEAIDHIRAKTIEPFGLKLKRRVRRHLSWLGERGLPAVA